MDYPAYTSLAGAIGQPSLTFCCWYNFGTTSGYWNLSNYLCISKLSMLFIPYGRRGTFSQFSVGCPTL